LEQEKIHEIKNKKTEHRRAENGHSTALSGKPGSVSACRSALLGK